MSQQHTTTTAAAAVSTFCRQGAAADGRAHGALEQAAQLVGGCGAGDHERLGEAGGQLGQGRLTGRGGHEFAVTQSGVSVAFVERWVGFGSHSGMFLLV